MRLSVTAERSAWPASFKVLASHSERVMKLTPVPVPHTSLPNDIIVTCGKKVDSFHDRNECDVTGVRASSSSRPSQYWCCADPQQQIFANDSINKLAITIKSKKSYFLSEQPGLTALCDIVTDLCSSLSHYFYQMYTLTCADHKEKWLQEDGAAVSHADVQYEWQVWVIHVSFWCIICIISIYSTIQCYTLAMCFKMFHWLPQWHIPAFSKNKTKLITH